MGVGRGEMSFAESETPLMSGRRAALGSRSAGYGIVHWGEVEEEGPAG